MTVKDFLPSCQLSLHSVDCFFLTDVILENISVLWSINRKLIAVQIKHVCFAPYTILSKFGVLFLDNFELSFVQGDIKRPNISFLCMHTRKFPSTICWRCWFLNGFGNLCSKLLSLRRVHCCCILFRWPLCQCCAVITVALPCILKSDIVIISALHDFSRSL